MTINLDQYTNTLSVTDTATNADLNVTTKGTGGLNVNTGGGTQFKVLDLTSTTTSINARGGVSGGNAQFGLVGAGNTDFIQYTLGTGAFRFLTNGIGVDQMRITHTASAVNYVQVTGAATTGAPVISSQGSDSNVPLSFLAKGAASVGLANSATAGAFGIELAENTTVDKTIFIDFHSSASTDFDFRLSRNPGVNGNAVYQNQGTGSHVFYTTSSANQLTVAHTASAVNYVQVTGSSTGNSPTISAQGSDSSINFILATKGSGDFVVLTNSGYPFVVGGAASVVNYVRVIGGATGTAPLIQSLGSDTNIPLVLQPKGTGALQAQLTDSTATGGNARGANAVDWSTRRNAATQVASGIASTVSGGRNNTASGIGSVVAGGGTFAGGVDPNTASGAASVISGGAQNINSGFLAVITGGYANNVSGVGGSVSGGWVNTVIGQFASIAGGYSNNAAGFYNFIGGGFGNSATSNSVVTTQSATMNATTAVTLSGSNANIKVGQYITGTSIESDTYVAAVSGTSLTLSKVASGSSTSTLSFFTPHGVVVGGGNNQATGSYSFIGGGGDAGTAGNRNVASGAWSSVVGGLKNTASGSGSFVGGGGTDGGATASANTATGAASFIGGGLSNFNGSYAGVISGGFSNTASAIGSAIAGGAAHTTNSDYSAIMGGYLGTTRSIIGNHVFPACNIAVASASGVSQAALLILGTQTTDATATVLRCNTSAAGTTNQVILPNNSAYFFTGEVVAGVTGGGNTKGWTIEGVIKRGANAASTALVGTPTVTSTYADAGASTWVIAVTADTTNGGLAVTFTGQASTTIRTVAKISTVEMTY